MNKKLIIGAGISLSGVAFAFVSSVSHTAALKRGVGTAPEYSDGTGGSFKVRATGYWPHTAQPDERGMEGKPVDRIGAPLHNLEDFIAGRSDHVSVAGDLDVFPYGQLLEIEGWPGAPNLRVRVVDTGGHFFDLGGLVKKTKSKVGKVYRVIGEEPLDFCVQSSKTKVPKKGVIARIVAGDHWAHKTKKTVAEVNPEKIRDQSLIGLDLLGAAPMQQIQSSQNIYDTNPVVPNPNAPAPTSAVSYYPEAPGFVEDPSKLDINRDFGMLDYVPDSDSTESDEFVGLVGIDAMAAR